MKKEVVNRIVLYFAGIAILSLGVVLNIKTNLGTAALNVIPYVISNTTPISLGTAVFVLYSIFVIVQLVLKKKIDILTILQLPMSLLFGRLVDLFNTRILPFEANSILSGLVMLFFAINLVAIGTTVIVSQNMVPVAPDGLVQTLGKRLKWSFGKTKMSFDLICILIAFIISLILARKILGIGIGTVLSMIFTGILCNLYKKYLFRIK